MATLTQLFNDSSLSIILASNPLAVHWFFFPKYIFNPLSLHFHYQHPLQATIISNLGCWQSPTCSLLPLWSPFLLVARSSPSSYNKNQTCHFCTEHPSVASSHLGEIEWSGPSISTVPTGATHALIILLKSCLLGHGKLFTHQVVCTALPSLHSSCSWYKRLFLILQLLALMLLLEQAFCEHL